MAHESPLISLQSGIMSFNNGEILHLMNHYPYHLIVHSPFYDEPLVLGVELRVTPEGIKPAFVLAKQCVLPSRPDWIYYEQMPGGGPHGFTEIHAPNIASSSNEASPPNENSPQSPVIDNAAVDETNNGNVMPLLSSENAAGTQEPQSVNELADLAELSQGENGAIVPPPDVVLPNANVNAASFGTGHQQFPLVQFGQVYQDQFMETHFFNNQIIGQHEFVPAATTSLQAPQGFNFYGQPNGMIDHGFGIEMVEFHQNQVPPGVPNYAEPPLVVVRSSAADRAQDTYWNPNVGRVCKFCIANKMPESVCKSHWMKSKHNGITLCKFLRRMKCTTCGATGDQAHTSKYCPSAKPTDPRVDNIESQSGSGNGRDESSPAQSMDSQVEVGDSNNHEDAGVNTDEFHNDNNDNNNDKSTPAQPVDNAVEIENANNCEVFPNRNGVSTKSEGDG